MSPDKTAVVAVVTGAGSGIGRRVALALHGAGYRVVLAGRRAAALDETLEAMGDTAGRALVVPTDVTVPDAVEALFERAVTVFGRVDLLFNNAGSFAGGGPVDGVTAEDWRRSIDVNLTGSFLVAQAAFRRMKAQRPQGGRIINNGSISAHVPRPNAVAYTAAKHAVTGLTRAIALEGRDWNIACGQIDIGNAATDMTSAMERGMLQADGRIAPEPTIDGAHVAAAVLQMAALPLEANIPFMTIMATRMPYIGRG
jgi:NAD(P)-dependent dehydrogenase (short-subunit alcohol dehydrogenase family)